jgi:hypothetical protein
MRYPIVHRFRPPSPKPQIGGYDLDAFVIEEDEAGDFDFRFELGMGLGIFWALPAALGDRLRLLHVDGAAYTVDEPELSADPFVATFGPLTFQGNGAPIVSVTIELTENPPGYACVVFPTGRAPVELRWPSTD